MDETELELASFIYFCPISDTNYEIIDKIKSKFGIEVSYSSVARFRKNLPVIQKIKLEKSRKEILIIIQFVINELKISLEKLSDSDNEIRLKLTNELRECSKLYIEILEAEIESLERKEPF